MATTTTSGNRNLIYLLLVIVLAAVAWGVMTMPDRRTGGEKIGDAIDALPQGVDKAARQLEDRSPGEKIGDAVKDAGDDVKNATNR
ncbi:MAG: hypothetical protein ACOYNL_06375 [Rickettsiales bacterium]